MASCVEECLVERVTAWGYVPAVWSELFAAASPSAVASGIEEFCAYALGSPPVRCEFVAVSVGSVHGLALADGRRVVVKLLRPGTSARFLDAVQTTQRRLAADGFPCPRPVAAPAELGRGLAVAESLLDRGGFADAHDPAVRAVMASGLAWLVRHLRGDRASAALGHGLLRPRVGRLWPRPHDARFDFEGSGRGAEWIDAIAGEALRVREGVDGGAWVVGHTDWRAENLRFAEGRLSAVYDWDSLAVEREAVLVGATAHSFTSNWAGAARQLPTMAEALAFIADYERARGEPFTLPQRRAARAALAYAMAYTARCEHSDAVTGFGRHPPQATAETAAPGGSARRFLAAHGRALVGG